MKNDVTALSIVKAVNSGFLLWDAVGHLVQDLLEQGRDATMDEVEAAALQAGADLDALKAAIQAA
jgi:hypothetical protein